MISGQKYCIFSVFFIWLLSQKFLPLSIMKPYGESRQIFGIISVLIWIIVCAIILFLDFIDPLIISLNEWPEILSTGLFAAIYLLLSFPMDLIGGHILPSRYGRSILSIQEWFKGWARAAGIHGLYYWLNSYLLLQIAQWLGLGGAVGWLVIQIILLGNLKIWIARLLVNFEVKTENDRGRLAIYMDHADKGFTGGIAGMPGNEVIIVPMYWKNRFSEKVMTMLLTRRHGAINTQGHGRGFLWALLWNAGMFALAGWIGGVDAGNLHSLLSTFAWFSLLSLGCLIGILPWFSRKAVWEIDRWTYYKGADADVLRESIQLTDQLQNTDMKRSDRLRAWLNPLPDANSRIAHMQTQKPHKGAWNTAWQAVYFSWAGINLFARMLPVNLGRPALWVFLPTD